MTKIRVAFSDLAGGGGGYDLDIAAVGGLRERLALVPDARSTRGLRHSMMSVLLIAGSRRTKLLNHDRGVGA